MGTYLVQWGSEQWAINKVQDLNVRDLKVLAPLSSVLLVASTKTIKLKLAPLRRRLQKQMYSGDLKSGLVWILNVQKEIDFQLVQTLNGI